MVVADEDFLQQADASRIEPLTILRGLLTHPYISLLRYSDAGPGPDAPREHHKNLGEVVPGWLIVGEPAPDDPSYQRVVHTLNGRRTHTAVSGNAVQIAENDAPATTYADLPAEDARARGRPDAIAAHAASSIDADLFITNRPYLHAVTWDVAGGMLVARPEDALPLVGLYLRTQDGYITYRTFDGTCTDGMNRGLFYWVGVRELLPEGWRWFSGCLSGDPSDDTMVYLAQSAFQRVQRALQARDAAHRALHQPPNNDTVEEALANLDMVFLALMGAVDLTARVAHRSLGIDGGDHRVGWRRKDW